MTKWGFAIEAAPDEYFTSVVERVVDGPQGLSWAAGQSGVLNLRGQHVDMILKPTTSVYAPYYLSSCGYAIIVNGTWPGEFDFAAAKSEPGADRLRRTFLFHEGLHGGDAR